MIFTIAIVWIIVGFGGGLRYASAVSYSFWEIWKCIALGTIMGPFSFLLKD